MTAKSERCWFQKDGVDLVEGIECICTFRSSPIITGWVGLEIYDVLHHGRKIAEIYAGLPRNCLPGYSFRLEPE